MLSSSATSQDTINFGSILLLSSSFTNFLYDLSCLFVKIRFAPASCNDFVIPQAMLRSLATPITMMFFPCSKPDIWAPPNIITHIYYYNPIYLRKETNFLILLGKLVSMQFDCGTSGYLTGQII